MQVEDVHAGLAGFKPYSRRTEQHIEVIQALRFALIAQRIESTKYYSRGWTYQEFLLSKRLLIFVDRQVSFQCQDAEFHRGSSSPLGYSAKTARETKKPSNLSASALGNRQQASAGRCTRGSLSPQLVRLYQNASRIVYSAVDARCGFLRSVVGILNVTSLFRAEKWISGMPSTMLDWALLWQPTGPLRRRSGHSFPSWYWIGWVRPFTRPGCY